MSSEIPITTHPTKYETQKGNSSDSSHGIEEFSSFDISDNESSVRSNNKRLTEAKLSRKCFYESEDDHDDSSCAHNESSSNLVNYNNLPDHSVNENNQQASVPQIERNETLLNSGIDEHSFDSFNDDYKVKSPQLTNPNSRMSSDTFGTPRTVDTRASTMTLGQQGYNHDKSLGEGLLLFSDAMIHDTQSISSPQKPQQFPERFLTKPNIKRLSRQNKLETVTSKDEEDSPKISTKTLSNLFSKMAIGDNDFKVHKNMITDLVPSPSEIAELQTQLRNCKIQIKLQNDFLRERFAGKSGKNINNEDLSEELERQIQNSINSSKYKFQLDQMNSKYCALERTFTETVRQNENLLGKINDLEDKYDNANQSILKCQTKLKALLKDMAPQYHLDSNNDQENVTELLPSLESHIQSLLSNNESLRSSTMKSNKEVLDLNSTLSDLTKKMHQKETEFLESKSHMEQKIQSVEDANFNLKSEMFHLKSSLNAEQMNNRKLLQEKQKIEHDLDQMKSFNNKVQHTTDNQISLLEKEVYKFTKENQMLKKELFDASKKTERLTVSMFSYHTLLLETLKKLIDPKPVTEMLQACKKLKPNSDLEDVLKVFAVAHNFEMEAISAILENYQSILNENKNNRKNNEVVIELKSQIITLTNKLHDAEKNSDMESTRIKELEFQNAKLMKIANDKVDKLDQLKQLRLDDLTSKWKTAEEALSQTNEGAKLKIKELEQEVQFLKQQLQRGTN